MAFRDYLAAGAIALTLVTTPALADGARNDVVKKVERCVGNVLGGGLDCKTPSGFSVYLDSPKFHGFVMSPAFSDSLYEIVKQRGGMRVHSQVLEQEILRKSQNGTQGIVVKLDIDTKKGTETAFYLFSTTDKGMGERIRLRSIDYFSALEEAKNIFNNK